MEVVLLLKPPHDRSGQCEKARPNEQVPEPERGLWISRLEGVHEVEVCDEASGQNCDGDGIPSAQVEPGHEHRDKVEQEKRELVDDDSADEQEASEYEEDENDLEVLKKIETFGEIGFNEAMALAKSGDPKATHHLKRMIRRDPEGERSVRAAEVLGIR